MVKHLKSIGLIRLIFLTGLAFAHYPMLKISAAKNETFFYIIQYFKRIKA